MKNFFYSLLRYLIVGAVLVGPAAAQTNLAGKWQGRLEVAPGKTITIQFVFAAVPGGGYSATMTSPDDGAIKNVSANTVKFAENQLVVDVPRLSGSYAGTLRNGVFEGQWSQEGAKLPLSLKPFETPTLTRADIELLHGEWSGKLSVAGMELTIVLHLSTGTGTDSAMRATFDVPEQGVKDWPGKDVTLDDGHFSVDLPKPQAKITGVFKGSEIVGQWNQLGNSTPLTLKKGRYVAATSYLNFPAEAREKLKGRWSGTLNGLAVAVRFEPDAQGRTLGYFDSTQQGLLNIAITQAELAGTKLNFGMAAGAKYTGELAGDKLTGEWSQPGLPKPLPLVLTREKDGVPIVQKNGAPNVQDMTVQTAAPYLGLYWDEHVQRPMIVVLYKDRLALELPWRTLRELNKTAEDQVWAYVENPDNLVKFLRVGAGPAKAMELRQSKTATFPRFEPEKGLPSLDELFARRPDPQRAKKLGALGTTRMSGSIERTTSQGKGSFEILSAGEDRARTKLNVDGGEVQIVVAGNRVWMQPQPSSPIQEMSEDMARATRLGGWMIATGDWRDEFKQARVLKRLDLDGKPVFLVHAAPEKGRQRLIYLDTENGLTVGYDEVYEIPGVGMVGCEIRFTDYREIEGVQIPFRSEVKYSKSQLGTWTYQVAKIETRLKLEKDPFTIK